MAEKPCNQCQHYDPIIRGKDKQGKHGRCAAKSTYPATEQKGQVFPPGVARAPDGELCKPVIVIGTEIVATCDLFKIKPTVKPIPRGAPKPLPPNPTIRRR